MSWVVLAFSVVHGVLAQTGNGYVAIYADAAGTVPCTTIPNYTGTTLYVIAKTAGESANGITGAEFRIEVTNPINWYITYTAPAAANVASGNPIDTDPNPDAGGGMNLAFPTCQVPMSGKIALGTLSVFNGGAGPTTLLVRRHSVPTNSGFAFALFVKCDSPTYTKVSMTPAPPDSCNLGIQKAMEGSFDDPIIFTTALNGGTPGNDVDLGTPFQQVLASFSAGTVQLPVGHTASTLQATVVTSSAIASVLQAHGVTAIAKARPDAAPGTDFFELYRLVLPVSGNTNALATDLEALRTGGAGIIYAAPNGVAEATEGTVELSKPDDGMAAVPPGEHISSSCTYAPPEALCTYVVDDCPNDPLLSTQWAYANAGQVYLANFRGDCDVDIDLDEAWEVQKGHVATKIAQFGTGVWKTHPDLVGRVEGDDGTHGGTGLTGIMVANANNNEGIAGMNWHAKVLAKYVDGIDDANIIAALQSAASSGARIFAHTWRLRDAAGNARFSPAVRIAFRNLYMENLGKRVTIAQMGDASFPDPYYPAAFDKGLIAVGGSTATDLRLTSSKTGNHIDVVAPGQYIRSTVDAQVIYPWVTGTGPATAHVAGLASLLLAQRSDLENDDIEQIIRISTDDITPETGWDQETGTGRINAVKALSYLQLPWRLYHLEVSGWSSAALEQVIPGFTFMTPPPGLPAGTYWVERWHIDKSVAFPVTFEEPPFVWARGWKSQGYNKDNPNYTFGWCEPLGTIQRSGCTMRTYFYDVFNCAGVDCSARGLFLGQFPVGLGPVPPMYAFSVLGKLSTTDLAEDAIERDAGIKFTFSNPVHQSTALSVTSNRSQPVYLAVFDVAGRLVRSLQDGVLSAGRHEYQLSNGGKPLASGIYFARLAAGDRIMTKKLVVLR